MLQFDSGNQYNMCTLDLFDFTFILKMSYTCFEYIY